MDWLTVFDDLLPSDTWYIAESPLEQGYARLSWVSPNQTERYGIALMTADGEFYGNQVIRASQHPQIIRLPDPSNLEQPSLAVRPWNSSAFATPIKIEVSGSPSLDDNNVLLQRLAAIVNSESGSPDFSNIETVSTVGTSDFVLIWRDGQLKRLALSNLPGDGGDPAPTYEFVYQSDGDANGIFHAIGTNFGTSPWVNPVTANRISVTNTSSSTTAEILFDRTADSWFFLNPINGQGYGWVRIDLGANRKAKINAYSIRANNYSLRLPRAWKLEGSNDDTTWEVIDHQTYNNQIQSPMAWLTIQNIASTAQYRYIRFKGDNRSEPGDDGYVMINEIELYGNLIR
jgi:hypothetical protein